MATTTTNFGWDIPQSTDLVKDGATAIAALGQDIDTALVGLKGGTTGQILSKTSGTDLAYTWITNDVGDITAVTAGTGISGGGTSGAVTITNSMATAITTSGDTLYGTGSGTFSRLGIGSTGQVLTVAAGIPSWATPSSTTPGLNLISPSSIAFSGTSASTSAGKTVFSACTSLSLNGVFSSTYDNYLIIVAPFTQSTDVMNFMRLRASGSDTTSGYNNAGWYQSAGSAWNTNPDVTDAYYHQQPGTSQGSSVINLQNPNLSFATLMNNQRAKVGQGSGNVSSQSGTTQFDGLTIYQASGNFTGTIRVYGIKN